MGAVRRNLESRKRGYSPQPSCHSFPNTTGLDHGAAQSRPPGEVKACQGKRKSRPVGPFGRRAASVEVAESVPQIAIFALEVELDAIHVAPVAERLRQGRRELASVGALIDAMKPEGDDEGTWE